MELTKKDGTLANIIALNTTTINEALTDPSVDTNAYKKLVVNIFNKAKETPGQKKAKAIVMQKKSKQEVAFYVYNAALAGDDMATIKKVG